MISRTARNSIIVAGAALLAVVAISAPSYYSASRTGEKYEAAIAVASVKSKAEMSALTELLAQVSGTTANGELPPAKVLQLATRWRVRLIGRPSGPGDQGADPKVGLRMKAAVAQKAYSTEQRLKREYREELASGWSGFWLRAAGYPKSTASTK